MDNEKNEILIIMKYIQVLSLILLSGCGQIKSDKSDCVQINLPLSREENIIKLSEIVDSVQYIPLETQDECLIGNVDKIIVTNEDCYLIVDKDVTSSVYLFDQEGAFVRKIGNRGAGQGEYVAIDDVDYDNEYVYIWDGTSRRILKYLMEGDYVSSLKFENIAYSMCCIDGGKFAFCCDYAPNEGLRVDKMFPSLMIFDGKSEKVNSDLFFESTISSSGYNCTLNNLCNGNLYLPLNDTIYHVTNLGVERKYVLKYDKRYFDKKNAYIEKIRTEQVSANDAMESYDKDMFPNLITYFDCEGIDVFFMSMGGFLYYGFYNTSTGVYREAAADKKSPIIDDMDGVAVFSPRYSKKNIIYSIMEPTSILEKQKLIPSLKWDKMRLSEESNPILMKMYMKRSV